FTVRYGSLQGAGEVTFFPELLVESRVRGARGAVRRAPVGHDPAFETPLGLEDVMDEMRVLAGVDAVHLVVGTHDGADAGLLHRDLEWQQVDLAKRPFVRRHVDEAAVRLLRIRDEVLYGGDDALRLDAAQLRRHDAAGQDRVLAKVFEVAPVPGIPLHVGAASQEHVEPAIACLATHDPAALGGQTGIEARGQRLGGGHGCRAPFRATVDVPNAERSVVQLQRGYPEP